MGIAIATTAPNRMMRIAQATNHQNPNVVYGMVTTKGGDLGTFLRLYPYSVELSLYPYSCFHPV